MRNKATLSTRVTISLPPIFVPLLISHLKVALPLLLITDTTIFIHKLICHTLK